MPLRHQERNSRLSILFFVKHFTEYNHFVLNPYCNVSLARKLSYKKNSTDSNISANAPTPLLDLTDAQFSLTMSTLAIWSRVVRSRDVSAPVQGGHIRTQQSRKQNVLSKTQNCDVQNDNGRLLLRKSNKILVTRCENLRLKCTKFDFSQGFDTVLLKLDLMGPTSKREGREGGKGRGEEGRGKGGEIVQF